MASQSVFTVHFMQRVYYAAHIEGQINTFYKLTNLQNQKLAVAICNGCEVKLSFNLSLSNSFSTSSGFLICISQERYLNCKACIRFKDHFSCLTTKSLAIQPHTPCLFINTILAILSSRMTVCAALPICAPVERIDQIMSLSQLELRIKKIFCQFPVPDFQFKNSLSPIDIYLL